MTTDTTKAIARAILRNRVGMGDPESVADTVVAAHEASQTTDWQDSLSDALAAEKVLAPDVGEDEGLLAEADRYLACDFPSLFVDGETADANLILRLASRLRSRPDGGGEE